MIVLGVILLILGFVFGISILWTIGIVLIVVGAVSPFWGPPAGRSVAGRPGIRFRLRPARRSGTPRIDGGSAPTQGADGAGDDQ